MKTTVANGLANCWALLNADSRVYQVRRCGYDSGHSVRMSLNGTCVRLLSRLLRIVTRAYILEETMRNTVATKPRGE